MFYLLFLLDLFFRVFVKKSKNLIMFYFFLILRGLLLIIKNKSLLGNTVENYFFYKD